MISLEIKIELVSWILTIILLLVLIPKEQFFEAQLCFLFIQALTWILGVLVVQFDLITYPHRLFPNVLKTSFSYEFFFLPAIGAIFYARYPRSASCLKRALYVISFPTILTILEIASMKFTQFVVYLHWTWYCSWLSILLLLVTARQYTKWFTDRIRN